MKAHTTQSKNPAPLKSTVETVSGFVTLSRAALIINELATSMVEWRTQIACLSELAKSTYSFSAVIASARWASVGGDGSVVGGDGAELTMVRFPSPLRG